MNLSNFGYNYSTTNFEKRALPWTSEDLVRLKALNASLKQELDRVFPGGAAKFEVEFEDLVVQKLASHKNAGLSPEEQDFMAQAIATAELANVVCLSAVFNRVWAHCTNLHKDIYRHGIVDILGTPAAPVVVLQTVVQDFRHPDAEEQILTLEVSLSDFSSNYTQADWAQFLSKGLRAVTELDRDRALTLWGTRDVYLADGRSYQQREKTPDFCGDGYRQLTNWLLGK